MIGWIIIGVIVIFVYQFGYSYGIAVGRRKAPNQADKQLQVENSTLKEQLDTAKKAIFGYQKESQEQKEYIAYLKQRLINNKIAFENMSFRE